MNLGINLSFAIKRWVEPPVWARIVRDTLGLELVQFTYDLLDPWWPESARRKLTAQVRSAANDWGLHIESAFSGLGTTASMDCCIPTSKAGAHRRNGGNARLMWPLKWAPKPPEDRSAG